MRLTDWFDMFPKLLVTEGSCMIDIHALFYSALCCSREMLVVNKVTKNLVAAINNRLSKLLVHIKEYYSVEYEESERNIPLQDGGVHNIVSFSFPIFVRKYGIMLFVC